MNLIDLNQTTIGIEIGSTRIKAVLINEKYEVIASGSYSWENKFENNFWTYSLDNILNGLRNCYKDLKNDVFEKYNITLTHTGAIGVSAMMHGYIVLDKNDKLLTPFRTWRNNNTETIAKELTNILKYPIPARWSIAHLYYAVNKKEDHVKEIAFQTTLAGYIHYLLTNKKVIGLNDASGMFPIDSETLTYDHKKANIFNEILNNNDLNYKLEDIFPKTIMPGKNAGNLTKKGALLLDASGDLKDGIPFVAPEGDAGTGMISTNTIKKNTGNISAGTSIFSMIVLDKPLLNIYPEVDLVTTPNGNLVAMIHVNNCSSDINNWVDLFGEVIELSNSSIDKSLLFEKLFMKALEGDLDAGKMLAYNYISGENITKINKGLPMFLRTNDSNFNLANFMRLQIYSAFATLKIGMNLLTKKEQIKIGSILGHGGIFTTKEVAQRFLANALNIPISVNPAANEGGPFGMAILAMYLFNYKISLEKYLDSIFSKDKLTTILPTIKEVEGYNKFFDDYVKGLEIVKKATKVF